MAHYDGMRESHNRSKPPADWTHKLVMLVGECIFQQRNGMDVLASAAWDDVVRHWVECEQGRFNE